MTVIRFEAVSRSFRKGRPWGIKDALVGSRGRRERSQLVWAVKDVSFAVNEGESIALLGHNGSGKSTTLKLLAGTLSPTSGTIRIGGRTAPLLELGAGFHPDLTGRENIFLNASLLGVSRLHVKKHFDEIVDFAGLDEFIDTPIRFYSSGMSARLGFAVAVHVEPDIVLIDEALAVGDAGFQEKCLARMRNLRDEGRTLILVTHSLSQAQNFCPRILVLERGHLVFDGHSSLAEPAFESSTGQPKSEAVQQPGED